MMFEEFDAGMQTKFLSYIKTALKEEKALAYISKRLQDSGLSHDSAKELIANEAFKQSSEENKNGLTRMGLGFFGFLTLLAVGYQAGHRRNLYFAAVGLLIGGIYMYSKSKKRLKYLNTILKKQ